MLKNFQSLIKKKSDDQSGEQDTRSKNTSEQRMQDGSPSPQQLERSPYEELDQETG